MDYPQDASNPVEASWLAYLQLVVGEGAEAAEVLRQKRAFYLAAASVFNCMKALLMHNATTHEGQLCGKCLMDELDAAEADMVVTLADTRAMLEEEGGK